MSPLIETTAFIFALVALGYASGWSGLVKQGHGEALTQFAVSVAVPLLLFRTMAGADFGGSPPFLLWGAYFGAVAATWAVAQIMVVRLFGRDGRAGVVGGLAAGFSNLVLLGIPFMLGIYGQAGFEILSLLVSVHLPVMVATTLVLFAWFGGEGAPRGPLDVLRDFAVNMLSNPLIVGILAGILWRLSGAGMPDLMARLVDALADVAGPVALFAVGLGLRQHGIRGDVRPAFGLVALKLFFMPAAALVAALLLGLPPLSAKVVVAVAALPSGINPYLIATHFGTGQALSSNAMSMGTAFAVLTTAFWLWVAQLVFG